LGKYSINLTPTRNEKSLDKLPVFLYYKPVDKQEWNWLAGCNFLEKMLHHCVRKIPERAGLFSTFVFCPHLLAKNKNAPKRVASGKNKERK
jgi:hypothetical protein